MCLWNRWEYSARWKSAQKSKRPLYNSTPRKPPTAYGVFFSGVRSDDIFEFAEDYALLGRAQTTRCCIWFAKTDAARFGEKGVRVLSVTPGNFETPMGNLEKDEAGPT